MVSFVSRPQEMGRNYIAIRRTSIFVIFFYFNNKGDFHQPHWVKCCLFDRETNFQKLVNISMSQLNKPKDLVLNTKNTCSVNAISVSIWSWIWPSTGKWTCHLLFSIRGFLSSLFVFLLLFCFCHFSNMLLKKVVIKRERVGLSTIKLVL